MPDFSPVVSLYNLNQIYTDLNNRIESLNTVYNPKGSDTKTGVTAKTEHTTGDVWNITDAFTNAGVSIPADTNWVYVTAKPDIAAENYFAAAGSGYWVRVGSFLDIARDDKAGLVCTGANSIDSADDADGTSFDRGLKLKATTNKAYITIPAATASSYGVITTGTQTFAGAKTFSNNVTVSSGNLAVSNGNLSVSGTATISGGSATTATLLTDTLKVQNEVDVEGSFTTGNLTAQNAAGTAVINVSWKPDTLNATSLTLQTDQISATSVTAAQISGINTLDVNNKTLTLGQNTTLTTPALNATTSLTAGTVQGITTLDGNTKNVTLGSATTVTTPALNATTSLTAGTINGITTLLGNNKNVTLGQNTTLTTPTITATTSLTAGTISGITTLAGNAKNVTLGQNTTLTTPALNATTSLTAGTINGITTLAGNSKTVTLGQNITLTTPALNATTSLTAGTISGITTLNAGNHTLTLGQNTTLTTPVLDATTSVSTGTLSAATIAVTNSVSADALTATNGTIEVTGSDPTGGSAVTVSGSLTTGSLATGSVTSGTLTVTNGITADSLAKRAGDSSLALTTASVSAGTLTLSDGSAYKTLTVKSNVTADSLTAQSGSTLAIENLTTVKAQSLYLSSTGSSANIDRALTVTSDTTVNTLSAGNATATIGSALSANTLSIPNGNLQVNGSGTATVGSLQVKTTATTEGNFLTLGSSSITGTGLNSTSPSRNTSATNLISSTALNVYGGGQFTGGLQAAKVFNAVWNDLSDRIEIDIQPEPGYAYALKDGHYYKTSKYMDQRYIGIESDTSGFEMGGKNVKYELNASVAGFVLAYVDKEYKAGTPLTVTKDGKLTKIRALGRILHPEMVVATFWKPEPRKAFGPEGAERQVNGRMWVKIK